MLRCAADSTGPCMENAEHFYEILHCKRFHEDETGPWHMISDGMSGAKCGEEMVNYKMASHSRTLLCLTQKSSLYKRIFSNFKYFRNEMLFFFTFRDILN